MLTRSVALACMLAALLPLFTTAPASAGAGSPPPALVGSWSNGSVSLVTYQNVGTGEFAPASGTGELYTVSADGHYVWAHLQQGSLYNCTSLVFSEVEGTVTAGKAGVVLAPSKNTEIDSQGVGEAATIRGRTLSLPNRHGGDEADRSSTDGSGLERQAR